MPVKLTCIAFFPFLWRFFRFLFPLLSFLQGVLSCIVNTIFLYSLNPNGAGEPMILVHYFALGVNPF